MKQTKFILPLLLSLCIGLFGWGISSAQDNLTESYLPDTEGISFSYPTGWVTNKQGSLVSVSNTQTTIEFYTPSLSQNSIGLANNDLGKSIFSFLNILGIATTPDQPTQLTIGQDTYIGTSILSNGQIQYVFLVHGNQLEDPGLVFVRVTGSALDLVGNPNEFLAIIKTFGTFVTPEQLLAPDQNMLWGDYQYITIDNFADGDSLVRIEEDPNQINTNSASQPGRPTSNTANTAPTTDVCNNVALEMAFVGTAFSTVTNQPLALLDDNANTGWSSDGTDEELWFDVVLNGIQTVTSIEFNGYASSGTSANSINEFGLSRWVADTESFETILDITALMQPGYQIYTFPPVTTDSLTFFLTTNHGGVNFEVADIKVCTDSASTGNTAGRPTTSTSTTTTNQTQPVAPTVPCTVQAINTSAELRVGPGTNRSIILYLSPDDTFEVIGTNTLEDGSRWWRLDKAEAAPKKAAQVNETWVSDAHMTEFGDCDAVGAVAAPRIIRAPRPAPQPNPATSSGGNTSGGNTSAPQPIPQEGSTDQFINFYADPGYIFEGECTTLHWLVQNVKEVYFIDYNGSEKRLTDPTGSGSETDCPTVPTGQTSLLTYALRVVPLSGADVYQYAEVTVDANFIDIGPCTPTLPFLSDNGTMDDRSVESYGIVVKPCGNNAVAIEIYVGKGSGDMDPYLYVTDTNGNYYGEDNDSGADFDALLNFCVFEKATIIIDVSNAFTDGTGDYYIQVTTKEQFCG